MTTVLSIALAVENKPKDIVKFIATLENDKLEFEVKRSEDVIWFTVPPMVRNAFFNQSLSVTLNGEKVFEYKYLPQAPKLSIHGLANIVADVYADLKLGAFVNEELEPILVSLYSYITEGHPKDYVNSVGFKTIPLADGTWMHIGEDGVSRYSVKRKLVDGMHLSKLCKFQNTPGCTKSETLDQSINFDLPIGGEGVVHYFEKHYLDEQDEAARAMQLEAFNINS